MVPNDIQLPASPCNRLCRLDPQSGLCAGCWRTMAEVARWQEAGRAERLAILANCAGRRAAQGNERP